MTSTACKKCKREGNQLSLVRCRESDCPLRPKAQEEQVKIAGPLAMVATLASLGLMSFYFLHEPDTSTAPKRTVAPSSESSTIADRGSTKTSESGGFWSWFSSDTPPAPSASAEPDENAPDVRAATRVTTFSCIGSLSASEEKICSNWGLATMDYNLSLLVQSVAAQSHSPASVRASQKTWQRELEHLGGDADKVRRHYQQRIEALSKQI